MIFIDPLDSFHSFDDESDVVEFDDHFLRAWEANGVDVPAVREAALDAVRAANTAAPRARPSHTTPAARTSPARID